jgi:IS5 family transposase
MIMVEQKYINARWIKKNDEIHYVYKNHVKTDKDSKLVVKYEASSAEVHDSQVLEKLVEKRKDKGYMRTVLI